MPFARTSDRRAEHLRKDAVLGGRIHRRTDADQSVSSERVDAIHHGECPCELEQVRQQHHAAFGEAVGNLPDERREQDEGDNEGFLQQRHEVRQALGFYDGDGGDEDGVVGQRREELRQQHRQHARRQQ